MPRKKEVVATVAARRGVKPGGDYLTIPGLAKAADVPEAWVRKVASTEHANVMEMRLAGDYRIQPHFPPTLAKTLGDEWKRISPAPGELTLANLKRRVGNEGAWLRSQLHELGATTVIKHDQTGRDLPHYTADITQAVVNRFLAIPQCGPDRVERHQIAAFFKLPQDCMGWLTDVLRPYEAETEVRRTSRSSRSFQPHYVFEILEVVQKAINELPEVEDRLSLDDICAQFPRYCAFYSGYPAIPFLERFPSIFPTVFCQFGTGRIDMFYTVDALERLHELGMQDESVLDDGWHTDIEMAIMLKAPLWWVREQLVPHRDRMEHGLRHLYGRSASDRDRQQRYYPDELLEFLQAAWLLEPKADRWLNSDEIRAFSDGWGNSIEHTLISQFGEQAAMQIGESKRELHYPLEVAFEVRRQHLWKE